MPMLESRPKNGSIDGPGIAWAIEGQLNKTKSTTTQQANSITEVDVIVVGAGFSGLVAASNTQKAGLKTILVEAKHRVGGRSYSQKLSSGGTIELGCTWINKTTQPNVWALVEKFDLETSKQYTGGEAIVQDHEGNVCRVPDDGRLGDLSPELADTVHKFFANLQDAISKFDIYKWDEITKAQDVSFAEWAAQQEGYDEPFVKALCDHLVNSITGLDVHQIGVQYVIDWVKCCGGFESVSSEGELGAQSLKVKHGTSAIATSLANALTPGTVRIHCPVSSITQYEDDRACLVITSTGERVKAKKVILAVPMTTYKRIQFSPPLPYSKGVIMAQAAPGHYSKAILTYQSPWWREAGLVGKITSYFGPITVGFDVCDSDGEHYSLAVFMNGEISEDWHNIDNAIKRQNVIIEQLAQLVGSDLADKARDILEYTAMEWTKEDYIFAGPVTGLAPGIISQHGHAIRDPFRDIHIAGADTSFEWKGYLEGAVTAGNRASDEVIKVLLDKNPKL